MGCLGLTVTYTQLWEEECKSRACAGKGRRCDFEDRSERHGVLDCWKGLQRCWSLQGSCSATCTCVKEFNFCLLQSETPTFKIAVKIQLFHHMTTFKYKCIILFSWMLSNLQFWTTSPLQNVGDWTETRKYVGPAAYIKPVWFCFTVILSASVQLLCT